MTISGKKSCNIYQIATGCCRERYFLISASMVDRKKSHEFKSQTRRFRVIIRDSLLMGNITKYCDTLLREVLKNLCCTPLTLSNHSGKNTRKPS